MPRRKVTTFLWFDSQAEEAAKFYVSLFPNSRLIEVTPGPDGAAKVVTFELDGVEYMALNGGPHFKLNEAASLYVDCIDQAEIDRLWEKLSEGAPPGQCGWLQDRFGLTWQIIPSVLPKMLLDAQRGEAVMSVMMEMAKLDLQKLQDAFDGK